MRLLTIGLNHKTAPLSIREQTVFTPESTPLALQDLLQSRAANEAVILSTCNRTELYSKSQDARGLCQWLTKQHLLAEDSLQPYLYCYEGEEAVRHLMRVASGLDSMVLGEPQILGQIKIAYSVAQQTGTVGDYLGRLFPTAFSVSKQIRTQTGIGNNPVSIAYAVYALARKIFTHVPKSTVILIGAGETVELVATHFHSRGTQRLLIANRSHEKASLLAERFGGQGIALTDLPAYLPQADIVVTATASQLPILGKGAVESALKLRKRRPVLMVDLAVPRDIEAEVADLEDIYLYHLDDLQGIIAENLLNREAAAKQAEELITHKVVNFMRELSALQYNDVIRTYREKIQILSAQALADSKLQLQQGQNPETVLQSLSHTLIQKIMHEPTIHLRRAAYDGDVELLLLARRLFNI